MREVFTGGLDQVTVFVATLPCFIQKIVRRQCQEAPRDVGRFSFPPSLACYLVPLLSLLTLNNPLSLDRLTYYTTIRSFT